MCISWWVGLAVGEHRAVVLHLKAALIVLDIARFLNLRQRNVISILLIRLNNETAQYRQS